MALVIATLGTFEARLDGERLAWLHTQKLRAALLVFLGIERRVSRARLIELFWPDADESGARHALNQTLYQLRRALPTDPIQSDGDTLRAADWLVIDAEQFGREVEEKRYVDALERYGGAFLDGTELAGSAGFSHWVDTQRARLERLHRIARRAAIQQLSGNKPERALFLAREWARLEPLEDEAHHQIIRLLATLGDAKAALDHFESYATLAAREGLDPLEETRELVRELRAQRATSPQSLPLPLPLPAPHARRSWRAAALVLAVLAALAMAASVLRPRPPVSSSLIAILPFHHQGDDAASYLEQGIVSLLAAKLSGADAVEAVDPNTLLNYAGDEAAYDIALGEKAARRFGAGYFVLGTIVAGPGRLNISASLYATGGRSPVTQVTEQGSADSVFTVVDRLAARLLVSQLAGAELAATAATTTNSLPALQAFLEGERLLRTRAAQPAYAAFQRATELDSTFALAYSGMARAAENQQTALARPAAEAALRHAHRLPRREQEILRARYLRVAGHDSVYPLLQSYVERYPQDADGWERLGDWLFHLAPGTGQSVSIASPALDRAAALDSTSEDAVITHRREIAVVQGRFDTLDSLLRRMHAPETTWVAVLEFARPNREKERQRIARWVSQTGVESALFAAMVWTHFMTNEGIERMLPLALERIARPPQPAGSRGRYAMLLTNGGRPAEAQSILNAVPSPNPNALVLKSWLAALPFLPPDRNALLQNRAELLAWNAAAYRAPPGAAQSLAIDSLATQQRSYLLGLTALQLRDSVEARARIAELEAMTGSAAQRAIAQDFATSLKAAQALAAGDAPAALRWLDASPRESNARRYMQPYALITGSPFGAPLIDRYVRASALMTLRNHEAAYQWFAGFNEIVCVPCMPFAAASHLRRAQIAEARQDRAAAANHYQRALIMWRTGESTFTPLRREAELGLQRVGAASIR